MSYCIVIKICKRYKEENKLKIEKRYFEYFANDGIVLTVNARERKKYKFRSQAEKDFLKLLQDSAKNYYVEDYTEKTKGISNICGINIVKVRDNNV